MPQPEQGEAHNHPQKGIKERAEGYSWGQRHERESGTRHVAALGDEAMQKGILQNFLRQSFQGSRGNKEEAWTQWGLPVYASDLLIDFSAYLQSSCTCHNS